jgi:hypothetical protein
MALLSGAKFHLLSISVKITGTLLDPRSGPTFYVVMGPGFDLESALLHYI